MQKLGRAQKSAVRRRNYCTKWCVYKHFPNDWEFSVPADLDLAPLRGAQHTHTSPRIRHTELRSRHLPPTGIFFLKGLRCPRAVENLGDSSGMRAEEPGCQCPENAEPSGLGHLTSRDRRCLYEVGKKVEGGKPVFHLLCDPL